MHTEAEIKQKGMDPPRRIKNLAMLIPKYLLRY